MFCFFKWPPDGDRTANHSEPRRNRHGITAATEGNLASLQRHVSCFTIKDIFISYCTCATILCFMTLDPGLWLIIKLFFLNG